MLDLINKTGIKTTVKGVIYFAGILIACYVTQLRLFSFALELGFKTPQTDNLWNLLVYHVPDFISVIFCFTYIIIFYRKIRQLRRVNVKPTARTESTLVLHQPSAEEAVHSPQSTAA